MALPLLQKLLALSILPLVYGQLANRTVPISDETAIRKSGSGWRSDAVPAAPGGGQCGQWTRTIGDSATFTFIGTAVYVIGDITFNPASIHATLDGSELSLAPPGPAFCNEFVLTTDGLDNVAHTLVLTFQGPLTEAGGSPNSLVIQRMIYTVDETPPTTSSSSSSSSTSSEIPTASTLDPSTSSTTATASTLPSTSSTSTASPPESTFSSTSSTTASPTASTSPSSSSTAASATASSFPSTSSTTATASTSPSMSSTTTASTTAPTFPSASSATMSPTASTFSSTSSATVSPTAPTFPSAISTTASPTASTFSSTSSTTASSMAPTSPSTGSMMTASTTASTFPSTSSMTASPTASTFPSTSSMTATASTFSSTSSTTVSATASTFSSTSSATASPTVSTFPTTSSTTASPTTSTFPSADSITTSHTTSATVGISSSGNTQAIIASSLSFSTLSALPTAATFKSTSSTTESPTAIAIAVISSKGNAEAIGGGVAGGFVAIVLLVLAFLKAHKLHYVISSLAFTAFGWYLFGKRRLYFHADKDVGPIQVSLFLSNQENLQDSPRNTKEVILVWQVFDIGHSRRDFTASCPCTLHQTGQTQLGFGTVEDVEENGITSIRSPEAARAPAVWNGEHFEDLTAIEEGGMFVQNKAEESTSMVLGTYEETGTVPFRPFLQIKDVGTSYPANTNLYLHIFVTNGYRGGQYAPDLISKFQADRLTPSKGIKVADLYPVSHWQIRKVNRKIQLKLKGGIEKEDSEA